MFTKIKAFFASPYIEPLREPARRIQASKPVQKMRELTKDSFKFHLGVGTLLGVLAAVTLASPFILEWISIGLVFGIISGVGGFEKEDGKAFKDVSPITRLGIGFGMAVASLWHSIPGFVKGCAMAREYHRDPQAYMAKMAAAAALSSTAPSSAATPAGPAVAEAPPQTTLESSREKLIASRESLVLSLQSNFPEAFGACAKKVSAAEEVLKDIDPDTISSQKALETLRTLKRQLLT